MKLPSLDNHNQNYEKVLNSGTVGLVKSKIHKLMEEQAKHSYNVKILELGAGSGFHKQFVAHYGEYWESDIKVQKDVIEGSIKQLKLDAQNLHPLPDNNFSRVIMTCLIAHLENPEKALNEARRVVENKGYISIWVPTETSIFLRTMQRISTRKKSKKLGHNYDSEHYLEHRNYYLFLRALLTKVFVNDEIIKYRFPFKLLPYNYNLVEIWTIKIQKDHDFLPKG